MGHRVDRLSGMCRALAGMSLLLSLVALPFLQPAWGAETSARIVAIGDVHGDLDALVSILQEADLIDDQRRWSGGNAILVQTGDLLDRGAYDKQVMDLLMELEKQAPRSKGRVVVLLGNHEMMNITGDLRYVAPEVYSNFADGKSEQRREKAYQDYVKLLHQRAQVLGKTAEITPDFELQWMKEHPPGFLEYREALDPKGRYGSWLRKRPVVFQVADTLFLHGGIHPNLAAFKVEELNQRIKDEIEAFDTFTQQMVRDKLILSFFSFNEIVSSVREEVEWREAEGAREDRQLTLLKNFLNFPGWLSIHADGPLWFRGFAQWSEEEAAQQLPQLLEGFKVKRFVVGHTPQLPMKIQMRFRGKVYLIDTGMLSSYYQGGGASALEIQDGKFTAIYLDRRKELGNTADE